MLAVAIEREQQWPAHVAAYPAYARSEGVKLQAALETLASKFGGIREEWKQGAP